MKILPLLLILTLSSCASAPSVSSGNGAIQRKAVSGPGQFISFKAYVLYVKNSDGELIYEDSFVNRNNVFSRTIEVKEGEYEIGYTCGNTSNRSSYLTKSYSAVIPAGKLLKMTIYKIGPNRFNNCDVQFSMSY